VLLAFKVPVEHELGCDVSCIQSRCADGVNVRVI
jgi:hypothetical protein